MEKNDKVKYTGNVIDEQINWRGNTDPRPILNTTDVYEIEKIEVHSWHTKIYLKGIEGKFNSVWFEPLTPTANGQSKID